MNQSERVKRAMQPYVIFMNENNEEVGGCDLDSLLGYLFAKANGALTPNEERKWEGVKNIRLNYD